MRHLIFVTLLFAFGFSFAQGLPNCGFTEDIAVHHFEKQSDFFEHMRTCIDAGAYSWRGYYGKHYIVTVEFLNPDERLPEEVADPRYVFFAHMLPSSPTPNIYSEYSFAKTSLNLQKDISYYLREWGFTFSPTCK